MEKIYEENIGGGSSNRSKLNFSIVLSFVVAAFAIVSLIAVGFNQISFAAPIAVNPEIQFYIARQSGTNAAMELIAKNEAEEAFNVPFYQADDVLYGSANAIPLFCIEHHVDATSTNSAYTKSDELTSSLLDAGVAFILNRSATLGGTGIVPSNLYTSEEEYNMVERYATQIAIWMYLHKKYEANPSSTDYQRFSLANYTDEASNYEYNKRVIEQAVSITPPGDGVLPIPLVVNSTDTFYDTYILPVVNAASNNPVIKTVSIVGDDKISKIGDDDYYQTEEMSVVSSSNDVEQFEVTVSGVSGAYVVDKNGSKVDNGTFTNSSDTFFVRIPVQSVSQETSTIKIDVNAIVSNYLVGAVYTSASDDFQRVVAIVSNQASLPAYKEISVTGSPDTGMNTAQTIYFIGLIVLLCGVGIVYANAKPVEEE